MIFQLMIIFLPWSLRRRLLVWRYGWEIDPSAVIKKSIILAKRVKMGAKSRIHNLVVCKPIDYLEMGEDSGIGAMTFITGFPSAGRFFNHVADRKCELVLGAHAGITSRHFIDCNGGVYIGDYTTVAGIRSQIMTHSIDPYECRQDAKPVKIGKYCFLGTGCIILPGAVLPDYCVLGAGSVLNKAHSEPCMVYAGSPAMPKKCLSIDEVKYFHRTKHVVD